MMIDMGLPLYQLYAMIGAMETGFFRHLKAGPADPGTLAERMEVSVAGVEALIKAMEPLGYIESEEGKYALSKLGEELPIDRLEVMVPYWKHQASVGIQEAGRGILEAPENGVCGREYLKSGEVGRGYQVTMRWLASSMVDEVVKKVDLPHDVGNMMDVGGGHGLYTMAFCRKYPALKGRIVDWPIGLEEAERTLKENPGLAERIELVEKDFEKEDLPGDNDFVFLGNIVQRMGPEGNRGLMEKLAKATTDRGMIAIQDQFTGLNGSRFARAVAGLVGFNLFLFAGGRSYDVGELKQWLRELGFTSKGMNLDQPGMSLLISRKIQ